MALEPIDEQHAAQILAGTVGRLTGHAFEERLSQQVSTLGGLPFQPTEDQRHCVDGLPAVELLAFIARDRHIPVVRSAECWWLGGLATTGAGDATLEALGVTTRRSKSDIVIRLTHDRGTETLGVSVKTCNAAKPTNAQLYFTTATSFTATAVAHGIPVTDAARDAMRMFCGDSGFTPADLGCGQGRRSDHSRWFWEELPVQGRREWESILSARQDDVTRILVQDAYPDDPFTPTYLLHQRFRSGDGLNYPLAIYSFDQFLAYSRAYRRFDTKPYVIRKGRNAGDPATHLAPRFGFVQFQRAGNKQHPTQLQFNLKAGYFNDAPNVPSAKRRRAR